MEHAYGLVEALEIIAGSAIGTMDHSLTHASTECCASEQACTSVSWKLAMTPREAFFSATVR
jgi:hypothetical protein